MFVLSEPCSDTTLYYEEPEEEGMGIQAVTDETQREEFKATLMDAEDWLYMVRASQT